MVVTLVQKYDPEWPTWFARLRSILAANLGDSYLAMEHVCSTSVPGMVAKPIIDIDVVIADGRFDEVKARLATLGYVHEGDKGIPGREAFDLRDEALLSALPAHHLYVCPQGGAELQRHLAFRDFLRRSPHYVEWLSNLKWSLAETHHNDRQAYMDGKAALVQQITELALQQQGEP